MGLKNTLKYKPLYFPLSIATISFVLIFIITTSFYILRYQQNVAYQLQIEKYTQIGQSTAMLWQQNEFDTFFKNYAKNTPEIAGIKIYSKDNDRIFTHVKSDYSEKALQGIGEFKYKAEFKKMNIPDIVRLNIPVKSGDNYIYQIFFYLNRQNILMPYLGMIQNVIMIITILAIIFLVYMVSFFYKNISVPLKYFITVSRNITRGRFKQKVKFNKKNEFKEFVDHFNKMIDFLWASRLEDRLAHPSTGLPTSASISEKVNSTLKNSDDVGIGNIYVINQDYYVRKYGVTFGENLMGFVTQTIFNTAYESDPNFYLSHAADSIFLGISSPGLIQEIMKNIIKNFETEISTFLENNNISDEKIKLSLLCVCLNNSPEQKINNIKDVELKINELKNKEYRKDPLYISMIDGKVEALSLFQVLGNEEEEEKPEEEAKEEKPEEEAKEE
ncbi:MAG: HAMP domain-containing protein, partial [Candidatus Muiribacteriota bacterium]